MATRFLAPTLLARVIGASVVAGVCVAAMGVSSAEARGPVAAPSAARVLADAQQAGHYAFVLFHRDDGAETQAMRRALHEALAQAPAPAVVAVARVTDPAEKALVDKYGVGRSPMPLTLAVAPNGAITGGFPLTLTPRQVAGAFVSPASAACLKGAQSRKLVLVCVKPSDATPLPAGVAEVQADPGYGPATEVVAVRADDAHEARLLTLLKVPLKPRVATTVVLGPTGQPVATFEGAFSKKQFIEALSASGGCCPGGKCGPDGCCPPKK